MHTPLLNKHNVFLLFLPFSYSLWSNKNTGALIQSFLSAFSSPSLQCLWCSCDLQCWGWQIIHTPHTVVSSEDKEFWNSTVLKQTVLLDKAMRKITCYTVGIEAYAFSSPSLNDCLKKKKIKINWLWNLAGRVFNTFFTYVQMPWLENGICVGIHKPYLSLPCQMSFII